MGTVNGKIYTDTPAPTVGCPTEGTATTFGIANQAAIDALAAFNNLSPASRPGGTDPGAGQLGALVLPPGLYKAAGGSFLITGSDLTLDAQGDTNAIWVFQTASTLTVGAAGAPRSIILVNGAQAKNVFWQVGTAATINGAGGGTMVGTIIASAGVTFSTVGNAAITNSPQRQSHRTQCFGDHGEHRNQRACSIAQSGALAGCAAPRYVRCGPITGLPERFVLSASSRHPRKARPKDARILGTRAAKFSS